MLGIIILLYGLLLPGVNEAQGMYDYRDWFSAAGYEVRIVNFTTNDNTVNAQLVADEVATIPITTPVHIVGHSMGGLSGRYYMKYKGGATRVSSYTSLDTAQQGLYSMCVFGVMAGGQMCPFNQFMKQLNNSGDQTPGAARYYQFGVNNLTPLAGAVFYDVSAGQTHSSILHDHSVFDKVLAAIEAQ